MAIKTGYALIKNRIEVIIDSNIPQLSNEYRDLIVNSIMTTLRDSGLKPYGWNPSDIMDFDDIKNLFICGYPARELVMLATRLRRSVKLENIVFSDNNKAFMDGYNAAREDFNRAIEESIKRMFADPEKE